MSVSSVPRKQQVNRKMPVGRTSTSNKHFVNINISSELEAALNSYLRTQKNGQAIANSSDTNKQALAELCVRTIKAAITISNGRTLGDRVAYVRSMLEYKQHNV